MAVSERKPLIKRWDKLNHAEVGAITRKTGGMSGFVSKEHSLQFGAPISGYEGSVFVVGGKAIPLNGVVVADFGDGVVFARQTPDVRREGEANKGYEFRTVWQGGNVTTGRVEVPYSKTSKEVLGPTFGKIAAMLENK